MRPDAAARRPCRRSAIRSARRLRSPPRRACPGSSATMLTAAVQEHERGLGNWPAEWETLPEIALLTSGALAAMIEVAEGLDVDADRMQANLDVTQGLDVCRSGADGTRAEDRAGRRAFARRRRLSARGFAGPAFARHSAARSRSRRSCSTAPRSAGCSIRGVISASRAHSSSGRSPHASELRGSAMSMANVAGTRIHYRIDGDPGAPPLVLSNSLGASLEMWEPQMADFAGRFRVIRYDTRGHGQSEAPAGPYTIDELGRDVVVLLDSLSIARAHFCGLSMGGAIGIWLGINASERVDRLVLANTGAKIGTTEMWNARIDAVHKGGTASIAAAVLSTVVHAGHARGANADGVADARHVRAHAFRGLRRVLCGCTRPRSPLFAGRIHRPTLVIAGSDDLATPPSDGRFLADAVATRATWSCRRRTCRTSRPPRVHTGAGAISHRPHGVSALVDLTERNTWTNGRYDGGRGAAVLGDAHVDRSLAKRNEFNDEFQDLITRYAWGEIWTRPGLPRHTRSLLTSG